MSDQTPNARPDDHSGTPGASGRPAGQDRPGSGASSTPRPQPPRRGRLTWLIPALTFLVGLLLGALVVGASGLGDDDDVTAAPVPTATDPGTSPTTGTQDRPDTTVTVPGACLDAAEGTQGLLTLVQEAATAAQELDAAELSSIVRQLQESQATLESLSNDCRSAAGSATTSG